VKFNFGDTPFNFDIQRYISQNEDQLSSTSSPERQASKIKIKRSSFGVKAVSTPVKTVQTPNKANPAPKKASSVAEISPDTDNINTTPTPAKVAPAPVKKNLPPLSSPPAQENNHSIPAPDLPKVTATLDKTINAPKKSEIKKDPTSAPALNDLEAVLAALNMSTIAEKLRNAGVDKIEDVEDLTEEELKKEAEIPLLHARKIKKYVENLRVSQEVKHITVTTANKASPLSPSVAKVVGKTPQKDEMPSSPAQVAGITDLLDNSRRYVIKDTLERELGPLQERNLVKKIFTIYNQAIEFFEYNIKTEFWKEMNMTEEEALSICLYTQNLTTDEDEENNLFKKLNKMLQTRKPNQIQYWYPYIHRLMQAMSKIPDTPTVVYRGMQMQDEDARKHYGEAVIVNWTAFTSTSRKIQIAATFGRVVCQITCLTGKDIDKFSPFPEEEILLLPNITYVVTKDPYLLKVKDKEGVEKEVLLIEMKESPRKYRY